MRAYHGSNAVFDKFDMKAARVVNDLFGGGIAYFTDDETIAASYARSMQRKKGGQKVIYEVELQLNDLFDVDHQFTGEMLKKFLTPSKEQDFARGAGLLPYGADPHTVTAQLKSGSLKLTGKQVFNGLSKGGVNSALARDKLTQMGFDGLRYNGGDMMGGHKHNVYLVYHPNSITILNKHIKESASLSFAGFIVEQTRAK